MKKLRKKCPCTVKLAAALCYVWAVGIKRSTVHFYVICRYTPNIQQFLCRCVRDLLTIQSTRITRSSVFSRPFTGLPFTTQYTETIRVYLSPMLPKYLQLFVSEPTKADKSSNFRNPLYDSFFSIFLRCASVMRFSLNNLSRKFLHK